MRLDLKNSLGSRADVWGGVPAHAQQHVSHAIGFWLCPVCVCLSNSASQQAELIKYRYSGDTGLARWCMDGRLRGSGPHSLWF